MSDTENNKAFTGKPKLFISYSWSSAQHEQWVLNYATELRDSSVDVILDKWDLKEGNDANAFMEQMVTDPEIKKVILVCDKQYAEKTDRRDGGVGTEAQIISPEIYQKQDQNKFVAVIAEKDENGKPYLPTYYKSRVYIDLSDNEQYTKNFEQVLRWIYDKPLYVKPEPGKKPAFLEGPTTLSLGTISKFTRAIDAIRNSRPYVKGALEDYFETFTRNLERFRITGSDENFDDLIIENINNLIPYRNEAVELFLAISQYDNTEEAHTQLHRFFEKLIPFLYNPKDIQSYKEWDFDNFKFIIHELFLYCIAALLKHEDFEGVAHLLRYRYFAARNLDYGKNSMISFQVFRNYLTSLDHRNSRLKLNRLSLHADLLKQRCIAIGVTFEQVMQADFVLYLRDCIDAVRNNSFQCWWPESLLWIARRMTTFEIFARAESKDYFDLLKVIFDVQIKDDFNGIFNAINEGKLKLLRLDYQQIDIAILMAFETLATRP